MEKTSVNEEKPKNQKNNKTEMEWAVTQGFINDTKRHVDERVVHKSGERGQ